MQFSRILLFPEFLSGAALRYFWLLFKLARRIKKFKLKQLQIKQRDALTKTARAQNRSQSKKPERIFHINDFPLFSEVPPEYRKPENILKLIGKEGTKKTTSFIPLANIPQPNQELLDWRV